MAIPSGYALFEHGWPPKLLDGVILKEHPLYDEFLNAAAEAGYDVMSEGFNGSENGYFMFFLMGKGCASLNPPSQKSD